MATPSNTSIRQFGIWRSRVYREFEKCGQLATVCPGATLYELFVDEERGVAVARFHVFVPFRDGSSALRMIPLTALEISMPFDETTSVQGNVQFPFCAPRVCIYQGAEYLPREMRHGCPETGETLVELPMLMHWSPSNTLVMVLQDFIATVQQSDPQTVVATEGASDGPYGKATGGGSSRGGGATNKRLRMRKRDIYGAVYQCQEVDSRTGTLRSVPMLLQSGNIVLLVPPTKLSAVAAAAVKRSGGATSQDEAAADHVYVSDLFALKDIARITPQRGKSITFFFKSQHLHCRTLLTSQTEAIIADLQRMIAAVGTKRARDNDDEYRNRPQSSRSPHNGNSTRGAAQQPQQQQDDGALSHLLSFLSPEQSEKAKEVSSKIVGKLSKWGNTVSRFFKGDDMDEHADGAEGGSGGGTQAAFQELERLKTQFFQYPSKPRMVEITTRYQQLAEASAQHNTRDGQVEKAIEEMQRFIEHPTTQKLLLEAYAVDSGQRGIRVGSL